MFDQPPNILILVSSTPAWLAEVAAPIWKLWPLKCCPSTPTYLVQSLLDPVEKLLPAHISVLLHKQSTWAFPHTVRKSRIATTGQSSAPAAPSAMVVRAFTKLIGLRGLDYYYYY